MAFWAKINVSGNLNNFAPMAAISMNKKPNCLPKCDLHFWCEVFSFISILNAWFHGSKVACANSNFLVFSLSFFWRRIKVSNLEIGMLKDIYQDHKPTKFEICICHPFSSMGLWTCPEVKKSTTLKSYISKGTGPKILKNSQNAALLYVKTL